MSRETDLWGLSGLAWLEANICRPWPEQLERQARETWLQNEDWIMQCHPWRGFLLLLREYINGEGRESEARLRKLIPVLARNGDPQQIIAAFSLLGVLILEIRGWEPEIEALHQQVQNERAEPGTLAYLLRQFLFAQRAVFSDRKADADVTYGALLGRQTGMGEAAYCVMGRIFEKMALYLSRYPSHSHQSRWKMAVSHWCARIPDSIVTRRLQSLEKHPIQNWRSFRSSLHSEGTDVGVCFDSIFSDRETEVIRSILQAHHSLLPEAIEYAVFISADYGDPFWMEQANQLQSAAKFPRSAFSVEGSPLAYRFTFFDSFQGFNQLGEPLFPSRYGRKKVKQLLALLLLQPYYRMIRDVVMDRLTEDGGEQNDNYLHVLLYRLREVFAKQSGVSEDWVMLRDGMVMLNEDRIAMVDVQDYKKLASVGHQLWMDDREAAVEIYERAVRMYRPILAPEFEYEDWMSGLRTELVHHQKRMLKRVWEAARENNEIEKGIFYGEFLLTLDEWDLSAARLLCAEWENVNDSKRIIETCERFANWFREEAEEVPVWITDYLKQFRRL